MSYQYDDYLHSHISNVQKAAEWLLFHFPDLLDKVDEGKLRNNLMAHDNSKFTPEEYAEYDAYFYGGNKSHKVVADFNYAWLHHIIRIRITGSIGFWCTMMNRRRSWKCQVST